ncbi:MAG: YceI family protein [Pseudomonadota bacterium]
MNIKYALNSFLTAGALVLPAISHADEFKTVQTDKTTLTFGYKQMGVNMDGRFKHFATQIDFDPAKLTSAKAQIDLDVASIDVGSDEGNDEVSGKLWFNVKAYPKASFVASSVKALGGNRYEVTGPLSIKGRTGIVTAPVIFTSQGKTGSFDGAFVIKRADFSIGEGAWAAFDTVANEIQIKFHIVAMANK